MIYETVTKKNLVSKNNGQKRKIENKGIETEQAGSKSGTYLF